MKKEILENAGIDYQAGLERFMNDSELYEAILFAFIEKNIVIKANEYLNNKDYQQLYRIIHEIKGSSGNAGLNKLYLKASSLVTYLRETDINEEEIEYYFKQFIKEYQNVYNAISLALNS